MATRKKAIPTAAPELEFINVGSEYDPLILNMTTLRQIIQVEGFTYDSCRATFADGREVYLKASCKSVMEALNPTPEVEEEADDD